MSGTNIQAGAIEFGADASGFNAEIANAAEVAKAFGRNVAAAGQQAATGIDQAGDAAGSAAAKIDQAGKKSGRSLADMAKAATEAGAAGSNIGRIGDGGDAAARKVEASTRSMVNSIQRTIAAMESGGKTGSEYYKLLAGQRGIDVGTLKPYLDQLDAVASKQVKTGISAGQMQAALRGVPAQFTDIAVSLASGQQPLTVLLQQGGQLKDMFGGAVPAAKALGGYIMGLVNPYSLAGAAIAGVGYAMYQGAEQFREYQNALTLTGNAAGITAAQMDALRERVAMATGQWGSASDAVLELVRSGKVGGAELEAVANATVRWSKATGQSVAEVAKEYAALAKDPVKSVVELSDKYGFLTASTYYQVTALEKLGRTQEAAILLQRKLAEESDKAAKKVVENNGWIDQLISDIKSGAGNAYDSVNSWGKPTTNEDRANSLRQQIDTVNQARSPGNPFSGWSDEQQHELDLLKKQLAAVEALIEAERKQAEQESKSREDRELSVKAAQALTEAARAGVFPEEQRLDAVRKLRQEYERATSAAAGLTDQQRAKATSDYAIAVRVAEARNQPRVDTDRLLDALAQVESGGRQFDRSGKTVTSSAGALGMYQIMPENGPEFAKLAGVQWSEERLRNDAGYGRQLASAYFNKLMNLPRIDGDIEKALTAYHSGQGTVSKAIAEAGIGGDWKSKLGPQGQVYSSKVLSQFGRDVGGNYVNGPTLNAEAIAEQKQIREMQDESRASLTALEMTQQGYTRTMADFLGLKATDAWKAMTPEMQKQNEAVAIASSNIEILSQAYDTHRALTLSVTSSEREYAAASVTAASGWREVAKAQAEFDHLKSTASWGLLSEKMKASVEEMFAADQAQRQIDASFRNATGLKLQADQLEETNKLYGLTEIQIGEYRKALLESQAAELLAAGASDDRVRGLKAEAEQQERINGAMRKTKELNADWSNGAAQALTKYADNAANVASQVESAMTRAFSGMEDALVEFTMTGKLSFADMANSIVADLIRIQIRQSMAGLMAAGGSFVMSGGLDGIFGSFGPGVIGAATGGYISGPGTSTSDSIPAWLSNGEYVIKADTVRTYGTEFFDRINTKRFATGGQVGAGSAGAAPGAAPNIAISIVNQSGQPLQATSSQPRFDGEKWFIEMLFKSVKNNGNVRDLFKR